MKQGWKAAVVCCSNGLAAEDRKLMEALKEKLCTLGLVPVLSEYLYAKDGCFSGSKEERAAALQRFFADPEIRMIFDVSGGDIANELLPCFDYETIAASKAIFCGYSDLTTVLNAVYAKTGKPSLWYQAKHLVGHAGEWQSRIFSEAFLEDPEALERHGERFGTGQTKELFDLHTDFLQGDHMEGVLVGGNLRCFLKLAGTPYLPDLRGKLLFLEARGGSQAQMTAYVNQLKQMGVLEQIRGILLGTFLQMEKEGRSMADLVMRCVGNDLPIAQTREAGHRSHSKAVWIGGSYVFSKKGRSGC